MVISATATPPTLGGISADAKVTRKFKTGDATLGTRKIFIGWTHEYTTAKYTALKTTGTGGDNMLAVTADTVHNTNIPWILKENTTYYVHIYYTKSGSNNTFTHAFKTATYPTTVGEVTNKFPGGIATAVDGSTPTLLFNKGPGAIERSHTY